MPTIAPFDVVSPLRVTRSWACRRSALAHASNALARAFRILANSATRRNKLARSARIKCRPSRRGAAMVATPSHKSRDTPQIGPSSSARGGFMRHVQSSGRLAVVLTFATIIGIGHTPNAVAAGDDAKKLPTNAQVQRGQDLFLKSWTELDEMSAGGGLCPVYNA